MKEKKNKRVRRPNVKQVAAFGAAMSTLAITQVPTAQADVVSLTPSQSSVAFGTPYVGSLMKLLTTAASSVFTWGLFNDSAGKDLYGPFNIAGPSFMVTASQSFAFQRLGTTASGTQTFGFKTSDGELGWIKMNLGGTGGDIQFLAAAFNDTPGESIHAGTGPAVPEPSALALGALGLLAAGATEVRRRRKALSEAASA